VVLHKWAVAPDQEAKLSQADLWGADLSQADLQGANLQQADLQGTNIRGANLIGVEKLTQGLVNAACVDENTILPEAAPSLTKPTPCPVTQP
jgi:uncharacterized protein YjbI with pentapeptide repeats